MAGAEHLLLGLPAVLTSVLHLLRELRLVGARARLHHYVSITTEECMAVSVFEGHRFIQVKVSESVNLRCEYDRCQRAWNWFGRFAPRPLGYGERDGWSVLALEGVHHAPLQAQMLVGPDGIRADAVNDLYAFFELAGGLPEKEDAAVVGLPRVPQWWEAQFANTAYEHLAARWAKHGALCGMFELDVKSQHGDFVLNNLGRTSDGLVVFDWEDFGKLGFPGLDLATLLLSLCGDDVEYLHQFFAHPYPELRAAGELVRRACASYRLDFDQFRVLLPVYLLMFVHLKQYYGQHVRQRFTDLLERLSARCTHEASCPRH